MARKPTSSHPYLPPVSLRRIRWLALAASVAWVAACGPSVEDLDDVYPRNCGVEGPVELFDFPMTTLGGDARRAGDHYLVEHLHASEMRADWVVDRCGETRALLYEGPWDASPAIGVGGEHVLSCDEATGAMAFIDPTGAAPPRPLFPAVEGCRVVPLGKGLAAQEKGGRTVWFHPNPADAEQEAIAVTDEARVADPDWASCHALEFDCRSFHPLGIDIRAAGEDLLVVLETGELLAFSSTSLAPRTLDPGPVFAMDVLSGDRHVVVSRELGPTLVVDRRSGDALEFCCWNDWEPIRLFGEWVVQGSFGSPVLPEPDAWTNFEALHMRSGQHTVVEGREDWHIIERITADTVLADIGPSESSEARRYVVSLSTGERQPVDLLGDRIWSSLGRDGVYALAATDETGLTDVLRHLAGPGQTPRVLLEDVQVAFATNDGRIVFERVSEDGTSVGLSVMLPDERIVELETGPSGAIAPSFWGEHWPLDRDEVVYSMPSDDDDGWMLRRTVLP